MLKVEKIELTDSQNRIYTIEKYQLESFPLIGGTTANMIKTKLWNEHGNTFVDSFMESFEGELIFALYTANKTNLEIEDLRRQVTNICNPLNGTIVMKITLNSGASYNRDITFHSAPIFPIGAENRNNTWQKIQLQYEANNPFWYSSVEIVETFQAVDPLFIFPFTMSTAAPILFGNILPSNTAINEGQVEAPVTIIITGACTNPRIDNLTTGEFIKFKNLTMVAGDILEVDTTFGQKKVLLNNQNVFNKLDFSSTFFNLKIGENSIDFSDDIGAATATIYFIYRNLYIEV